MHIQRLLPADRALARETFAVMARVFDEGDTSTLDDAYVDTLLRGSAFWAYAALVDGRVVGGITAHTLPMTRSQAREVFIYDLAVVEEHQRRGVGRALVEALRKDAAAQGVDNVFVPADNEDTHALDFYRALGGDPAPVTMFTFR